MDVGEVTVDVVNLDEAVVVVAMVADVVVGVVANVVVVVVTDETVVWVFGSDMLEVGFDFWSILSELDFSEVDGLEAFEESLSFFSSGSSIFAIIFLLSLAFSVDDASVFFAGNTREECVRQRLIYPS